MQFMSAALAGKDPGTFQPPPQLPPHTNPESLDTSDLAPAADESH
jgi:hypothetical protein